MGQGKLKRVALYVRVSTEDQRTANQERELRKYVQRREGWTTPEGYVFKDEVSGTKERRPGLDALKQAVHRRKVHVVLCTKLDRLARSLTQLVDLGKYFKEHGVDLVVVDQQIDTTTSAGKALYGMLGVFAEFEHDLIVERTMAGLATARAEGKTLGRPRIGQDIEEKIREHLKAGHGIHKTAKLVGVGSGTVQRVRADRRPGGGRRRRPHAAVTA